MLADVIGIHTFIYKFKRKSKKAHKTLDIYSSNDYNGHNEYIIVVGSGCQNRRGALATGVVNWI